MTVEPTRMTISWPLLTRRGLVLGLGGLTLAPAAFAAPALTFPLRISYARITTAGFIGIRGDEQLYWTQMQTRLGGLIDAIEPIQPSDLLGTKAPEVDGGASSAMAARQIAADAGSSHVIIYATQDGQWTYKHGGSWVSRAFASLRADLDKDDRASGEAYLLDVMGGSAVVSVSADAASRNPLNLFDNQRNPERETLANLIQGIERRLQDFARPFYEAQRSIAD